MPDLKDIDQYYYISALIVPGVIITDVRAQFISGKIEKIRNSILAYLTLTIIYYGIIGPLIDYIISIGYGLFKFFLWWCIIIIGPAIFGVVLGLSAQYGWGRWLAAKWRLRVVHATPTSWDWRFASCTNPRFVVVTLADGSTVAGIFGTNSFASTEPTERDLYIQEIMDISDDGQWAYRKEVTSILIVAKEIRFVEFKGGL